MPFDPSCVTCPFIAAPDLCLAASCASSVHAATRIADGAIIVVDAAEGVMMGTERALRYAVMEGLPICVVINLSLIHI